ncbi:two-partner secretion domain-containing protein [Leptolyngbya sp. GGD]|uniref:two-partner secretion domain-containing protein n=1 Tax=Leptolyngbya sp. GGD TaxID=2997907 RepID=UPI00227C8249|nr:filamentous hemagglutinin N-terminal domain-containing protein [Leptolyngbya sp. GGD]MCY6493867.1 filamentous hemagglutinin N-terminal domain-containing protein [Leptolyngbya sp. GGD]
MKLAQEMKKLKTSFVSTCGLSVRGSMQGSDRLNFQSKWIVKGCQQTLLSTIFLLVGATAQAQITPDGTLGGESSRVNSNAVIGGRIRGELIEGGAQRQGNLFHSFREFNISDGQKVYFDHPIEVKNVITRITGNSSSNIDGRLGVVGNANLFLINPNGIFFGSRAQLDIGGSFLSTTANAIGFGTQGKFSATNPQAVPLLTVNPSSLLYTQLNSGMIENRGSLRVLNGQSLLLVGGDVRLNRGVLSTIGGRIELGGLAGIGEVNITTGDQGLQLQFPKSAARSDVLLDKSLIDLVQGGGNLSINSRNITLQSGSLIFAGISSELGSFTSQSGDITLNATETIQLDSESEIRTDVNPGEVGNGGNIKIETGSLFVFGNSALISRTSGVGNAGDVIINARDRIVLSGDDTTIDTSVRRTGSGKGGNIRIATSTLEIFEGAQLLSVALGKGNAGDILIDARDRVSLIGGNTTNFSNTGIFSSVGGRVNNQLIQEAQGKGGNISIASNILEILNNAQVSAGTYGLGDSGNIVFEIRDRVRFNGDDTIVASRVERTGRGKGGEIYLSANTLELSNGATLNVSTLGSGDSGNILLSIRDRASFNNGNVFSAARGSNGNGGNIKISARNLDISNRSLLGSFTFSSGNAGNIYLATNTLKMSSNSELIATTFGAGNAGDVRVNALDLVSLNGAAIRSQVSQGSRGNAGNISIITNTLKLTEQSSLSTSTYGFGKAGDIKIDARNSIFFNNSSASSFVAFTGQKDGGNIEIRTSNLMLSNGSDLSTFTFGDGNAGNIQIDATNEVVFSGRSLSENISGGLIALTGSAKRGGNILVNTNRLRLMDGAIIDASAFSQGNSGNITLNAANMGVVDSDISAVSNDKGQAGDVTFLATRQINFSNSRVLTRALSIGEAGDIQINSPRLKLDNQSTISAESANVNGGNINLSLGDFLVLRRNSSILATAGLNQQGGNGGNITLNANAIVAVPQEGSSIRANAFQGRGGNITVNTNGLFGLMPGVDITASSQLGVQGQVTIAQPEVQPTQGVLELPTEVVDASNQIGQVCPRNSNVAKMGKFVVSGSGSLPPNPIEPLTGSTAIPLATIDGSPTTTIATVSSTPNDSEIVEAQGWVKTADGKVTLVAQSAETTPSSRPTVNCSTVTQQ